MTSLGEARAFLDHFLRGDWGSCHVRADGLELFVARTAGHANPMVAAAADDLPAVRATLRAPHVGTIASLAAVGTRVAAGETYATLALLDETVALTADAGGVVVEQLAAIGTLAEHDRPLIALG